MICKLALTWLESTMEIGVGIRMPEVEGVINVITLLCRACPRLGLKERPPITGVMALPPCCSLPLESPGSFENILGPPGRSPDELGQNLLGRTRPLKFLALPKCLQSAGRIENHEAQGVCLNMWVSK